LPAAFYALLDAKSIERDAEPVEISVLAHDVTPIYIVMVNADCAALLATQLSGFIGRWSQPDVPAWVLSAEEVAGIITGVGDLAP